MARLWAGSWQRVAMFRTASASSERQCEDAHGMEPEFVAYANVKSYYHGRTIASVATGVRGGTGVVCRTKTEPTLANGHRREHEQRTTALPARLWASGDMPLIHA